MLSIKAERRTETQTSIVYTMKTPFAPLPSFETVLPISLITPASDTAPITANSPERSSRVRKSISFYIEKSAEAERSLSIFLKRPIRQKKTQMSPFAISGL